MSVSGCTVFGGDHGNWKVTSQTLISGIALPLVSNLKICSLDENGSFGELWKLKGVISNVRYVEKTERDQLRSRQEGLNRPDSICAALLPIKKSQQWWEMTQDERREIFEQKSKHIEANLKYLPAIARQLYHSRDIGEEFDFLTWFEFRQEDTNLFNDMINGFRETLEWKYVIGEIDFRLTKV